jgi:hypothetical protein
MSDHITTWTIAAGTRGLLVIEIMTENLELTSTTQEIDAIHTADLIITDPGPRTTTEDSMTEGAMPKAGHSKPSQLQSKTSYAV